MTTTSLPGAHGERAIGGSPFVWSPAAWFGTQIGATAWIAVLGALVLPRDLVAGSVALASFALLAAWSWLLWTRRAELRMHRALQLLLGAVSVLTAGIVVLCRARGVLDVPELENGLTLSLPWWMLGVAPALMLVFAWREHAARRR